MTFFYEQIAKYKKHFYLNNVGLYAMRHLKAKNF